METNSRDLKELKEWLNSIQDQPLEAMDDFFTARIDGYDEHMLSHWSEDYPLIASHLSEDARKVLDLGCGTGLELRAVFDRFPKIHVTGIDLSWTMLKKLAMKYPDQHITLRCEDYFTAELDKESYDAVISFESLHHFKPEKKRGLYTKLYGALKKGGIFLLCDYFAWNEEHEELLMDECEKLRKKWKVEEDVFVHFDTPLTPEHEMELLQEAGFDCTYEECVEAGLIIAVKADLTRDLVTCPKN